MWSKAKLFKDDVTAEMILQEADPDKIKALGRSVKGYKILTGQQSGII